MSLRYIYLTALALLVAFTSPAQPSTGYEISGHDARLAGKTIHLLAAEVPDSRVNRFQHPVLQSAQADASGRFLLRGQVPAPDIYLLRVDQNTVFQRVPLANRNERITVEVVLPRVHSPENPEYLLRPGGTDEVVTLQVFSAWFLLRNFPAAAGDKGLRDFSNLLRRYPDTYVAPYLAYYYLRLHPSARSLLDSLTTRFAQEQPDSPYLPRLQALRHPAPALNVGALAPDFTLPDGTGQPTALRSLRGHYVLMDFWASWCTPCRAENPNVQAAYQRYHDRGPGFTVLSVSVDEHAAAWQQAVAQDALPWTQVRDEKGIQGPTGQLYQLKAIPATLLLDPQGRIVAKDLRGAALHQELARLLR
ncbi:TlpA family protein disulfide reductase [Hymenobacter humi]|uniref:TlpA family protein disulfide reductase n=1 Tax=Hymenobacter humi TaxID=1411620 RepID=A0ABW2U6N0_9BACT